MSGLFRTPIFNLSNDASATPGLIEELWAYLTEKYFTLDLGQYENLGLDNVGGGMINLSWAIIALCLGIVLAAIMAVFEKRGLGEFVRKLLSEECYTPETAKTLAELGYRKNAAVRGALRSGSLSKVVKCAQKEAYNAEIERKRQEYEQNTPAGSPPFKAFPYKINYETDTFYIPKDDSYAADLRYDKRGSGIVSILISIAVAIALAVFIIFILPEVLQLLDNFVGLIMPEANYH